MRGFDKKRLALVGLVPLLGIATYLIGGYFGSNHSYTAALEALKRRDFRSASTYLEEYLDARPGDLNARLLAAQSARRQGDFAKATHHLEVYRQQSIPNASLDLEGRLLRIHQGDLTDAEGTLSLHAESTDAQQTALVLEAYIEGTLKVLVPAYIQGRTVTEPSTQAQLQRTHQAIERWLQLQTGQPDQVQGLIWRFHAHHFAHAQAKAWADIRKAVELDGENRDARYFLATLLAQETPAEAAYHLQILCNRKPDDLHAASTLANIRRRLGQLQDAKTLLDQVLAANPESVAALLERGRIALDQQDAEDAERWLRRAYELAPRSSEVVLALSSCLLLRNKPEEANSFQILFDEIIAEEKRQMEKVVQPKP